MVPEVADGTVDMQQLPEYPVGLVRNGLRVAARRMISHRYRCIFVHVPKAAGQSIERFFLELHGLSWANRAPLLLRRNDDPARGPERLAHLFAPEYVACGHIGEVEFDRYFKFAFVRNPWDRLVSEYLYQGGRRIGSFRQFVLEAAQPLDPHLDAFRHLAPQVRYLYDRTGRLRVDFVGRFERLQDDFARVCDRLGIPDPSLPHVNAAPPERGRRWAMPRLIARSAARRDRYVRYYDRRLRDLVAERYAEDIEAFGYAFGGRA